MKMNTLFKLSSLILLMTLSAKLQAETMTQVSVSGVSQRTARHNNRVITPRGQLHNGSHSRCTRIDRRTKECIVPGQRRRPTVQRYSHRRVYRPRSRVIVHDTRPAPVIVERRNPNRLNVKHGLGLNLGQIGGSGLAYRAHINRIALQLGGGPDNFGGQMNLSFIKSDGLNLYGLAGFGVFSEDTMTPYGHNESTLNLGAGLGIEMNLTQNFGLVLEAPIVQHIYENTESEASVKPSIGAFFYF